MKVRDLIEILQDYDENAHVIIGARQTYGSDFAYDVDDVETVDVTKFWGKDEEDVVCILESSQIGTI